MYRDTLVNRYEGFGTDTISMCGAVRRLTIRSTRTIRFALGRRRTTALSLLGTQENCKIRKFKLNEGRSSFNGRDDEAGELLQSSAIVFLPRSVVHTNVRSRLPSLRESLTDAEPRSETSSFSALTLVAGDGSGTRSPALFGISNASNASKTNSLTRAAFGRGRFRASLESTGESSISRV